MYGRPDGLVVVGTDLEAERDATATDGVGLDDAAGHLTQGVEFGVSQSRLDVCEVARRLVGPPLGVIAIRQFQQAILLGSDLTVGHISGSFQPPQRPLAGTRGAASGVTPAEVPFGCIGGDHQPSGEVAGVVGVKTRADLDGAG